MEVKDAYSKINKCIVEQLGELEENIKPYSHLKDDLGMDSLDDVELVMLLEEEFDIQISDEEAEKCLLVKDVYIGILDKLGIHVDINYFNQLKPYETTKQALIEAKNCTFTSSDIFKRMLSIAKENNLFIQFDGFTQNENDTIVVTHAASDTEYVVKDGAEFNELVESLTVLSKFERK